ncbi:MAG TPA: enoyl-CoA hydratase/isomerase family protein [Ilumatobacteraceae bacterium]|jgi:enoyl-CoA hydratase/carnithine racemase
MTEHPHEQIRVTREGTVATIWLNRPAKRNAMNYSMWARLEDAARQLAADRSVRVVVLRGSGRHFCAGADITELNVPRRSSERSFAQTNIDAEDVLAAVPKPTVAFISGDCIGGGCALAIDCDLRIATPEARFGITPAKLGIVYPASSLERVTRLIGPAATKRLLFTGDLIDATEALRIGLVDEVVETGDAANRLATLTAVLASRSLLTQVATKSMVAAVLAHGHVPADVRATWADAAAESGDLAEGIAAFADRREPNFGWSGSDGRSDGF